MPPRVTRLLTAAVAFGPAAIAAAQDHEAVGAIPTVRQGLVTGITALVVFLLVLAVLSVKVWPVMSRALDERSAKIREEIEAAERARKQARDALDQYQKSLAEAKAEAQRMLEATKAQQQQLAAELRAKADQELNIMKDRARRDIDAARRAALVEIHDQAIGLATAAASRILKREVTVSDQRRLLEESLGELAGSKN